MNLKNAGTLLVLFCQSIIAQTASTYFPSQTGFKWNYESVPLDSLNNPVTEQKYFSIDSFAVVTLFSGKDANIVLSKTGPQSTINFQPYTDSIYYNFESSNGFEYFDPELFSGLLGDVDTTLGINFITFFNSLKGWYSYYRFSSGNDIEYQIFKKDTAITVNTISATIRFELIGKKLQDESLNTAIGIFDCKKFLLEVRISYLLLNIFPVKMFGVENTVWLAPENWKVKSYIPTTNVDLSYLGFPAFKIPGLESNITTSISGLEENNFGLVNNFKLYQNHPNPFNPITKISWQLPVSSNVTLKLYSSIGEELETIVDEYFSAGFHSKLVTLNSKFPSGVYFYQLKVDNLVQSKKMILIK